MNLLISASSEEKAAKMLNEYYYSTSYRIENKVVYNNKGLCTHLTVKQNKGRTKIYTN